MDPVVSLGRYNIPKLALPHLPSLLPSQAAPLACPDKFIAPLTAPLTLISHPHPNPQQTVTHHPNPPEVNIMESLPASLSAVFMLR